MRSGWFVVAVAFVTLACSSNSNPAGARCTAAGGTCLSSDGVFGACVKSATYDEEDCPPESFCCLALRPSDAGASDVAHE
jgi:hypothetical protein